MIEARLEPPPRSRVVDASFRVRYAETDAMGIAHHSSYIVWMEMGRTEFMRVNGFTYRELESIGVNLPVLEVAVRYRRPAFYDDELRVSTWVEEISRTRIKMVYRVDRVDDGLTLAEGYTLHTYTGRDGRPVRVTHYPDAWARLQEMAKHAGPQGKLQEAAEAGV